jgi:hypothetical protein
LYGVHYTRLDLALALLMTAALALLVCRLHWWLAMAMLAVAIHFKLMPAVLAPLWIVASLPALSESWPQVVRRVALRTAVLAGFGLAILIPYYLMYGPAVLEFLAYHSQRGIEIESTWATLLLPWRVDWIVYHSHGSFNVHAPPEPLVAVLAMPLAAMLLLAATALFAAVARRRYMQAEAAPLVEQPGLSSRSITIAQRWPHLVVAAALLSLLISIVFNKVFSPQYLLWVLPLVPLVDFRPGRRWLFFAATFAVCFLTMRIFPDCMIGEIVRLGPRNGDLPTIDGPTVYGAMLLVGRNGLCLALTAVVGWSMVQMLCGRTDCQSFLQDRALRPAHFD